MAINETPPEQSSDSAPSGSSGISAKWLIIGGGAGGGLLLVIVVVLVVLFVTGVFGGGLPKPASTLDLVPDDAWTVATVDIPKVLESDYLADEFDPEDIDEVDDWGIHPDDVSEVTYAVSSDGEITVLKGDFNLNDIRDEFEDQDGEQGSYRGYEIWEDLYGDGSAALLDGYVIESDSIDTIESALKNLYNGSGSLEQSDEDNEMKRLLDKLGRGYVVYAAGSRSCHIDRCEGYGYVVKEVDDEAEETKIEIAFLFGNERAAERAADDYDEVADFLEDKDDLDIEDTEAEGSFVVGVAYQKFD